MLAVVVHYHLLQCRQTFRFQRALDFLGVAVVVVITVVS